MLITIRADYFAAGPGGKSAPDSQVNCVIDELRRAVAHCHVYAAGMVAAEGKFDRIERKAVRCLRGPLGVWLAVTTSETLGQIKHAAAFGVTKLGMEQGMAIGGLRSKKGISSLVVQGEDRLAQQERVRHAIGDVADPG